MQYLGIMGVGLFKESEPVYFGTFGDALFTMLQMLTFDSWASLIARKRIHEDGIAAAIYFVSFIFIGGIIMLNVVVAVLLEKFLDGTGMEEDWLDFDNDARFSSITGGENNNNDRDSLAIGHPNWLSTFMRPSTIRPSSIVPHGEMKSIKEKVLTNCNIIIEENEKPEAKSTKPNLGKTIKQTKSKESISDDDDDSSTSDEKATDNILEIPRGQHTAVKRPSLLRRSMTQFSKIPWVCSN